MNIPSLKLALEESGFRGEVEHDSALLEALSTDNSVYRIVPDVSISPHDSEDVATLMKVLDRPEFLHIPMTVRGGGTGTNGQSLNTGIILDMRRHMNRLISVDPYRKWADVESGIVLDDLNAQLQPLGVFFAPETSTSTRCTIGGMVSTDASGKGSRIYGKTSDNLVGIEIARGDGLLSSLAPSPEWARDMVAAAESAALGGRDAFVNNTPQISRRYTGYDLERACPGEGRFEWWRLFPGSEGTLGPITKVRVKLWQLPRQKRLVVAAFSRLRDSLAAATQLLADNPTAIEVMDERVQGLAEAAGLLTHLPKPLRTNGEESLAFTFLEFTGDNVDELEARVSSCKGRLTSLPGVRAVHVAEDLVEIRELWAIRSAAVGLLGKLEGRSRPVAFVEDCVVPPEELAAFLDGFLEILGNYGLSFGIYGHVDVGCLHIRPALDIDIDSDRQKLLEVSDAIFELVNRHGGIFWGEHGKGVRGAYLEKWIGEDAYRAFQGIKKAFDPVGRFNPGKLVSNEDPVMGIATTPFRPFNSREDDPLKNAFRCNGNAQCLSYDVTTPMCPSFKATNDVRHSPKGRADALRAWREDTISGSPKVDVTELISALDTCLGCKACATSCPVQVDIPTMRAAFLEEHYRRAWRPLVDQFMLLAERLSPWMVSASRIVRPMWPVIKAISERVLKMTDLPEQLASSASGSEGVSLAELGTREFPSGTILIWMDWFSALFDERTQHDFRRGMNALGYKPHFVEMTPVGKIASDQGDTKGFQRMADRLESALHVASLRQLPMIGLDPAFVMALRQDYLTRGRELPEVLLPQEFLVRELNQGMKFPQVSSDEISLFLHCTERSGVRNATDDWRTVFSGLGVSVSAPETGCCGMAGVFGHHRRHQEMSSTLFELSWAQPLELAKIATATGFSCRCQVDRMGKNRVKHPLGLIADLIDEIGSSIAP